MKVFHKHQHTADSWEQIVRILKRDNKTKISPKSDSRNSNRQTHRPSTINEEINFPSSIYFNFPSFFFQ